MGAQDSHGVVIGWVGSHIVHRPDTGKNHGYTIMRAADWELFPSLIAALEAGYIRCVACFRSYGR